MKPIYTAFYTLGTLYEKEADRLRRTLDLHNLEHDIRGVASRGGWHENTRYTATHIRLMQEQYADRPLVYLDADAVVLRRPVLFDELSDMAERHPQCPDIAAHWRRGTELLNGTIWLAPSQAARDVIHLYEKLVTDNQPVNEQKMLDLAISENSSVLRIVRLPASYCWIHDIMRDDLAGSEPVIEHLQASRERHDGEATQNRRRRVAAIESVL